jgi:triosephosphate isomerase
MMPRTKLIAANWKMNKTPREAESFCATLKASLVGLPDCELALFPPFIALPAVAKTLEGTGVAVGAQDLFWETSGAFTGEISGGMIADAGGTYVLVGHSERRHVIGESNAVVARKLGAAVRAGLTGVLCVGERIEDRDAGRAEVCVAEQLSTGFAELDQAMLGRVVMAYEPVWAIGTGRTAAPDDAEIMHRFIRGFFKDRYDGQAAATMRILYGGSVSPQNAGALLRRAEIDGALIGGASLDVESYLKIARAAAGGDAG